jgi:hypothetical protein
MRSDAPDATARSAVVKLQPPLYPIEAELDPVDLADLLHVGDVLSGNVAFDRDDAQIEVPKLLDQSIHLAIDAPQVFEDQVLRFFSRWTNPPDTAEFDACTCYVRHLAMSRT